jgi:hypothetical protein
MFQKKARYPLSLSKLIFYSSTNSPYCWAKTITIEICSYFESVETIAAISTGIEPAIFHNEFNKP